MIGAPGTPAVTLPVVAAVPAPTEFTARTVKVYEVPLVRPVAAQVRTVGSVIVHPVELGVEVTV